MHQQQMQRMQQMMGDPFSMLRPQNLALTNGGASTSHRGAGRAVATRRDPFGDPFGDMFGNMDHMMQSMMGNMNNMMVRNLVSLQYNLDF
jgi:hypothetical protein